MTDTNPVFFFRSNARRMAPPTLRLSCEKSVWSGFKPQRVVSCGLLLATSTMTFAPSSPMSFRSKLVNEGGGVVSGAADS